MTDQEILADRYTAAVNGVVLFLFFPIIFALLLSGKSSLSFMLLVAFLSASDLIYVFFVLRLKRPVLPVKRGYLIARLILSLSSIYLFYYSTIAEQISTSTKTTCVIGLVALGIFPLIRVVFFPIGIGFNRLKFFLYGSVICIFFMDFMHKCYFAINSAAIEMASVSNQPLTVVQGGGGFIGNHHVFHSNQRYAIDAGFYENGVNKSMGIDALSPVNGSIASVRFDDKNLDNDPAGNYVVIKIDKSDLYVMIAHLKSITVKPGDVIFKGQRLGHCGSSGNTGGEPHFHMQVQTEIDYKSTTSTTLPFRFSQENGTLPIPGTRIEPTSIAPASTTE